MNDDMPNDDGGSGGGGMPGPGGPASSPAGPPGRQRRALALAIAVLAAGAAFTVLLTSVPAAPELPVLWQAPDFALVDQTGDTIRTRDLDGTTWVASFIFTNCTGACPLISARMARLRDSLAADGSLGRRIRLVSFSVDPERDTPDVLRAYAARYGASPPAHWAFLTGSPPADVRALIQEGFHLADVRPAAAAAGTPDGYQVMHSPRLLLVDPDGAVRATYVAREPGVVTRVLTDARRLTDDDR